MVRKVKVTDANTGETLREDYVPTQPLLFGFMSPSDILKVGSATLAVVVFFVNGQNDKKLMQDNLAAMQVSVSRLTDFRDNSDRWNTTVYNTGFRNGEPIDPSFKVRNKGNL